MTYAYSVFGSEKIYSEHGCNIESSGEGNASFFHNMSEPEPEPEFLFYKFIPNILGTTER